MILLGFVDILKNEGFHATIKQIDFTEVLEIYHENSKQKFIYTLNKITGKIYLYPAKYPELLLTNIDNIK